MKKVITATICTFLFFCSNAIYAQQVKSKKILIPQKKDIQIILTPFTENTLYKNGIIREFSDATLFTLHNLNRYKCKYLSAFVRGIEPYDYSEESKNPYFILLN
jgi:hypothetical protein